MALPFDSAQGKLAQGDTVMPYMSQGAALRALAATGAGKITHVVYIVQENRSFDNLFQGYPGADTVNHGKNSRGQTIELKTRAALAINTSSTIPPPQCSLACDGRGKIPGTDCRMDGFDREPSRTVVRSNIPSTSTFRTASRSRTSIWRTNGWSRTACSSRSSTRASSPSVRHRRAGSVERGSS